jgi:hypothetical protein
METGNELSKRSYPSEKESNFAASQSAREQISWRTGPLQSLQQRDCRQNCHIANLDCLTANEGEHIRHVNSMLCLESQQRIRGTAQAREQEDWKRLSRQPSSEGQQRTILLHKQAKESSL